MKKLKLKIVGCQNCKYFKRNRVYLTERVCRHNDENRYTREYRCCNNIGRLISPLTIKNK
jgi:hypothetical protein